MCLDCKTFETVKSRFGVSLLLLNKKKKSHERNEELEKELLRNIWGWVQAL